MTAEVLKSDSVPSLSQNAPAPECATLASGQKSRSVPEYCQLDPRPLYVSCFKRRKVGAPDPSHLIAILLGASLPGFIREYEPRKPAARARHRLQQLPRIICYDGCVLAVALLQFEHHHLPLFRYCLHPVFVYNTPLTAINP
eukprot:1027504-Pelagomonas_calceolata.AAC.3